MSKGDRGERELANRLEDEFAYRTLRAPASGSSTDRDRPDVLAGKDGRVLVFEVKTSSGQPVYVTKEEVKALLRYANGFGGGALVAVRWMSNEIRDTTIYCAKPEHMHETEKFYRAKYEDCVQKPWWHPLEDIV